MDYYLSYTNCLERLLEEYKKYGKLIIAYDFDDTVNNYHKKEDRNYDNVISLLQECKKRDIGKFICLTASKEERYKEITEYLDNNNIPVDKINTGFEGMPNGNEKPYYNILLDDRAGLITSYKLLTDLLKII